MIQFRGRSLWLKDILDLDLRTREDAEEFLDACTASCLEDFTGFETMEQAREMSRWNILWSISHDMRADRAMSMRLKELFWPEEVKHLGKMFEELEKTFGGPDDGN